MTSSPCWISKKYATDDTQRDSVSGEFFKNTRLESVIREAIQNSLDAKDGAGPSKVRIYYSGIAAAIEGAVYASKFRGEEIDAHYGHAKSGLEKIPERSEKCVFLTIEDFNTTGLTGDVMIRPTDEELESNRIKGNYYNYFFRENRSDKAGSGSLGSWGAGKIMFMKASRLRTAFTLSQRDDAKVPCFLAGRSVLMSHSVGDDTFAPDYWFGVDNRVDNPPPRYMRKQPIIEAGDINEFSELFKLSRKQEKGTSIVIPYLDVEAENGESEFSLSNIVSAVIKNFMIAILNGDLEVMIETGDDNKVVVVSKNELTTAKRYLPETPDSKVSLVTRSHYELAAKSQNDSIKEIQLRHVSPGQKSVWCDEIFKDVDLKQLKKVMLQGKALRFIVPMTVQGKSRDGKIKLYNDNFTVLIQQKPEVMDSFLTAYYRVGLLIDEAGRRKGFPGYVSLVDVHNGELAKLLVASEPPSHSGWDGSVDRVRKYYANSSAHIAFVTSAVDAIISRVEASDQEPDKNVLSDSFGIPVEEPPVQHRTDPKKGLCPECGQKPCVCPRKAPTKDIPEEFVHVSKLQSRIGFTISMKQDRVSEKGYPVICPFVMGYAPFTTSSWSRFDFDLSDPDSINIELENKEQNEIVDIETKDNLLTIKVKKPGAFRIMVTGFDENRDLEISKKKYVYPEVKEEE